MARQNIKYALWTGGWDSTFMLIRLLRRGHTIQPIYIIDENRSSLEHEKKAMINIRQAMAKHNFWGGNLLPTKFYTIEEIPTNKQITETWQKVNQITKLGTQHEWLARFAKWKKLNLYLGHEKGSSPNGHMTKTLNDYATLKKDAEGSLILDRTKSTKEGWILLGRMVFPIMDCTETDMLKKVKEWKVRDIMQYIWFCHTPTPEGKPCGKCHPCTVKLDSDMFFLLPRKIVWKYKINKIIQKLSSPNS